MDGGESFDVLASPVVVTLFLPLIVLFKPQAVKVLLQPVAILELVVGPFIVVRAGLLEHLVEDHPLWGASRLFVFDRCDEVVIESLTFVQSCFLFLLVILFWALYWDPRHHRLVPFPCRFQG